MKELVLGAFALVLALPASAETKFLECKQSTADRGLHQTILVKIDDASDKAEVSLFETSDDCAKYRSCSTAVYKKETLPSVVRLTYVDRVGDNVLRTFITVDISRTDLSVNTQLVEAFRNMLMGDKKLTGWCEVTKVDEEQKLL